MYLKKWELSETMRTIISTRNFILITLIIIIIYPLYSCSEITSGKTGNDNAILPADYVEVIYFHRKRRCEACTFAEERIKYIVNTYFQNDLQSGRLKFSIYEVEDKNNSELVKKYGAIGSQLFINRIINGTEHIRYIEEIWYWGCIDNEQVFDKTVKETIGKSIYGSNYN